MIIGHLSVCLAASLPRTTLYITFCKTPIVLWRSNINILRIFHRLNTVDEAFHWLRLSSKLFPSSSSSSPVLLHKIRHSLQPQELDLIRAEQYMPCNEIHKLPFLSSTRNSQLVSLLLTVKSTKNFKTPLSFFFFFIHFFLILI